MNIRPFLPVSDKTIPDHLQDKIQAYLHEAIELNALAEKSLRSYSSASRKYLQWCRANHKVAVPADEKTMEGFARFLVKNSQSKASVEATLRFSVAFLHKAAGHQDFRIPDKVRLIVRGATRTGSLKHAKQSKPIRWSDIELLMQSVDRYDYSDMVSLVGVMVAYDTATRIHECLSLKLEEMEIQEDGSAIILLSKSKQDQNRRGSVKYLSKTTVGWLFRFRKTFGLEGEYLISKQRDSYDTGLCFTVQGWCWHFDKFCIKYAIKGATTHAMRIGFANDARENESISDVDAAEYIGWEGSSSLERFRYYTRGVGVKKGAAAKMANAMGH